MTKKERATAGQITSTRKALIIFTIIYLSFTLLLAWAWWSESRFETRGGLPPTPIFLGQFPWFLAWLAMAVVSGVLAYFVRISHIAWLFIGVFFSPNLLFLVLYSLVVPVFLICYSGYKIKTQQKSEHFT